MGEDLADLISNMSPLITPTWYYATSVSASPEPISYVWDEGADPETLYVEELPPTKLTRFKRRPYRKYT